MNQNKFNDKDYRPQFSGHETFPLRYGWLKKAYDAVNGFAGESDTKSVFTRPESIADFGVGKNMVLSLRHWAAVTGMIDDADGVVSTSALGDLIFSANGLDPYLEYASTLWLLHWKLAGHPKKTTWYWSFNLNPHRLIDRQILVRSLYKLAEDHSWTRSSIATIKRDVDCFVRTYVPKTVSKKFGFEDALECPLTELGLIKNVGGRDSLQFIVGPKPSLGMGVFLYALEEFWGENMPNTISLESIAHEPGSPGRVFQLDETDLIYRLSDIEKLSNYHYRWSETAGLKQLIRSNNSQDESRKYEYLMVDYMNIEKAKLA